jgi:hypothetical protein
MGNWNAKPAPFVSPPYSVEKVQLEPAIDGETIYKVRRTYMAVNVGGEEQIIHERGWSKEKPDIMAVYKQIK